MSSDSRKRALLAALVDPTSSTNVASSSEATESAAGDAWRPVSIQKQNRASQLSKSIPSLPSLSIREDARRTSLPVYSRRSAIVRCVDESPVSLIEGGTGCGKSTQIIQYLAEDAAIRQEQHF